MSSEILLVFTILLILFIEYILPMAGVIVGIVFFIKSKNKSWLLLVITGLLCLLVPRVLSL